MSFCNKCPYSRGDRLGQKNGTRKVSLLKVFFPHRADAAFPVFQILSCGAGPSPSIRGRIEFPPTLLPSLLIAEVMGTQGSLSRTSHPLGPKGEVGHVDALGAVRVLLGILNI